jgi:tRNA wybutosine-synthesizing protein 4
LQYEIMLLNVSDLSECANHEKSWDDKLLAPIGLGIEFSGPRPLLAGHVSCSLNGTQVLIVGGGAVCFSFGTCWNEGTWLLQSANSVCPNAWCLLPEVVDSPEKAHEKTSQRRRQRPKASNDIQSIPRVSVNTSSDFQSILEAARPVMIQGADVGPCVELWTKDYLRNTVGNDRKVSSYATLSTVEITKY